MKKLLYVVLIMIIVLVSGCCKKILMPPDVDLAEYEPVGIINFTVNAEGELDELTTQRFIEYMRWHQTGIEVLELGDMDEVLAAVNEPKITIDAIKKIGEHYEVKALIVGNIDVSDIQPNIDFSPTFPYVSASADIEATLISKMYKTLNGASVWSGARTVKTKIGSIKLTESYINFNAKDPVKAYGDLVDCLVWNITWNFRNTWECEK